MGIKNMIKDTVHGIGVGLSLSVVVVCLIGMGTSIWSLEFPGPLPDKIFQISLWLIPLSVFVGGLYGWAIEKGVFEEND